jgi:hypothetical protein
LSIKDRYSKDHGVIDDKVAGHEGCRSGGVHDQIEKGNVKILRQELEPAPVDDLPATAIDIYRALDNWKEKESIQYTRFSNGAEGESGGSYR